MSIRSTLGKLWNLLMPLVVAGMLTSCEEKITDIGTVFLRDTVFTGTHTFGDLFTSANRIKQSIDANGLKYNITYASPYLFYGISPEESIEAWSVLKVPFIHDSLGTITRVVLKLSMRYPFMYGSNSEKVEFSVYAESKKLITEGTTSLTLADLDQVPVGTFIGMIKSDSLTGIEDTLDVTALAPLMRTTGLSLVIVPNASMQNIRAFASNEIGADLETPYLAVTFSKTGPDTTYTQTIFPTYDFSLLNDRRIDAGGEFTIRGGVVRRERFTIDIKGIRSKLALDPYSTINNALLELHLASSKTSITPTDTLLPIVAEIAAPLVEDSAEYFFAYGARDDVQTNVVHFQLRELIEQAIRRNQDSLVVEIRTGFPNPVRVVNSEGIGIEDYHLNRWTFYSLSAPDSLKRPRLLLTYSFLR